MTREEALRQLKATTRFTFVGDKVLLRHAGALRAVAEVQLEAARATRPVHEQVHGPARVPAAHTTAA